MEHKHTPGPWVVEILPSGRITVTAGQFFITGDDGGLGLCIENARLIAAAPELLDALRELVACKRMKEQIAIQQGLVIETDEDMEEMDRIMSDYARRQPKAWENAALIRAKATGATHE